jgi:hypothetical protein
MNTYSKKEAVDVETSIMLQGYWRIRTLPLTSLSLSGMRMRRVEMGKEV